MNNPVRAIVIMVKVMIAVAILLIIAGFTIGCINKAKAADIKLLKTPACRLRDIVQRSSQ